MKTLLLSAVASLDQTTTLRSIGIDLPLAEVYERVDFTSEVIAEDAST